MTGQHEDHDIHGPVIEVRTDGSTALDPDCDCPSDCWECAADGINRAPAEDDHLALARTYRRVRAYAEEHDSDLLALLDYYDRESLLDEERIGDVRAGVMQAIYDAGVHTDVCDDDTVPDMARTALAAVARRGGPSREQWARWLVATADHADDPEITDGMRAGLRLAAEHLRSDLCATKAAGIVLEAS